MTVGIFGGTGFIGRHLAAHLAARGVDDVRVFGGPKTRANRPGVIAIDIEKPSTYREELASLRVLVLLVSQSTPTRLESTPVMEIEENLLPHARLLELIERSDVRHVVYLSSGGTVYGLQGPEPIDEDHPTVPRSYYGLGKLLIEKTLAAGLARMGRSLTILRPSNPVGAFQELGPVGFVSRAVAAAIGGAPLEIWGDGSVVRDYFAVADLCEAIALSIFAEAAQGQVFNVSSGVGRSVSQVIAEVSAILSRPIATRFGGARPSDVPVNVLSPLRIRHLLGWQATTSFEEIVRGLASHGAGRTDR